MEYHSEHQSNFDFNFHETQSFHPEYLPEVVTPYFINKATIAEYSKKNFFQRFFGLPRMTSFLLDSLEKNNEFSLDLHNSFQHSQRTVTDLRSKFERLNEKFLALEGVRGELASSENKINEKLRRIEDTGHEMTSLKLQISGLRNQNRFLWPVIILSVVLNLITSCYLFLM